MHGRAIRGVLLLAGGLLNLFESGSRRNGNPLLSFLVGGALLAFALALWNAQAWARWAAVGLCVLVSSCQVGALVVDLDFSRTVPIGIGMLAAVYLLNPATARSFARARGGRGE